MVARKHLVVVVPGIGGSILEQAGKVAWDAGFGSVTRLGLAAHRLSLAEAPAMRPIGLIRSRVLVPGWTVVCGYDRLMTALGKLPGAVVDEGNPDRRVPDANVVAFPYDFRTSITEAAERLAAEVTERLSALGAPGEAGTTAAAGRARSARTCVLLGWNLKAARESQPRRALLRTGRRDAYSPSC